MLLRAVAWRLPGWLLGAGEVWLAMCLLGHPVGVLHAVIVESLAHAFRGAGFLIPGSVGIQDSGIVFVVSLLGVGLSSGWRWH